MSRSAFDSLPPLRAPGWRSLAEGAVGSGGATGVHLPCARTGGDVDDGRSRCLGGPAAHGLA